MYIYIYIHLVFLMCVCVCVCVSVCVYIYIKKYNVCQEVTILFSLTHWMETVLYSHMFYAKVLRIHLI